MSTITILGFDQDAKGKPLKLPDSWSYSRYSLYNECPAKFAYKNIIKLSEPQSEAMARGNEIHSLADKYVSAQLDTLPPELESFATLFDWCRDDGKFFTEQQWGFTKDWEVTGYMSFNGPKKTYFRAIVDLGRYYDDEQHMLIIDHKTGKKYDVNEDQVELFALSSMVRFPAVKTVEARLWYLDNGEEVIREYDARDRRDMLHKWNAAIEPMMNDTIFAPRKNKWCSRCHFSRYNGGPCSVA